MSQLPNTEFNRWYDETFGNVRGHEDADNRESVKKIWNGALEYAARQFQYQIFDEMTGDEFAARILAMKASKE